MASGSPTTASVTNTSSSDASSTTGSDSDNFANLILGAESLVSEYFPSTTITNFAALTWPATVVIDGSTYVSTQTSVSASTSTVSASTTSSTFVPLSTTTLSTKHAPSTSSTTVSTISPTSTSASNLSADTADMITKTRSYNDDKRLGIALGVILGAVTLGLLALIFFLMHRRRKRTGTYLRHQPTPDDEEIASWRSPPGTAVPSMALARNYQSIGPSAPHVAALLPIHTRSSSSSGHAPAENSYGGSRSPAYAPMQATSGPIADHYYDGSSPERVPLQSDQEDIAGAAHAPLATTNRWRPDRPPTPLMHGMMGGPVSPASPTDHDYARYQRAPLTSAYGNNPFSSPEDHEADARQHSPFGGVGGSYEHGGLYDDIPQPPARSPERRNSPQYHYVTPPEASGFDFDLANQGLPHSSRFSQGLR